MHIIWKNNAKYRVFTELHCSYTDHIFRREPIRDKSGKISNEKLDNHLNSLLNYCLLNNDIKEIPWAVLALQSSIKDPNTFYAVITAL